MEATSPKHAIKSRWINRLKKEAVWVWWPTLSTLCSHAFGTNKHAHIHSHNITSLKSGFVKHLVWLERLCSQIKINLNRYHVHCVLERLTCTNCSLSLRAAVQVTYIRSSMLVSMETTMRRCCTLSVCVQKCSRIFHCVFHYGEDCRLLYLPTLVWKRDKYCEHIQVTIYQFFKCNNKL